MKACKVVIAAVALAYGSSAAAENLVWFGKSESGTEYYYDLDSIKKDKGILHVWTLTDASKDKTVSYIKMRSRFAINCSREEYDIPSGVMYNSSGNEGWDNPKYHMRPIVPGSFNETLIKIICKN